MRTNKAALHRGNDNSAKGSRRTTQIITDYERSTLLGGLLIAVSFGLMFLWAAVMW